VLFFERRARDRKLFPHDPFKGMIIPRPIGWISTVSRAGAVNLAERAVDPDPAVALLACILLQRFPHVAGRPSRSCGTPVRGARAA
jgi:hypothetical protein